MKSDAVSTAAKLSVTATVLVIIATKGVYREIYRKQNLRKVTEKIFC